MKQVDFLKEQLRRLTIERKQLEETIGVVAGVVRFFLLFPLSHTAGFMHSKHNKKI